MDTASGENAMRETEPMTSRRIAHRHHEGSSKLSGHTRVKICRRRRLQFDWLGSRVLPSTFLVTNTDDSGLGSLRQAILDSNASTGDSNRINFAIPGAGVHWIVLTSPLPPLTTPTYLDGSSQAGFAGRPLIVVTGPADGHSGGLVLRSCQKI